MGCAGSGARGSGRGDKKAPGMTGADSEAGWWRMGEGEGGKAVGTKKAARGAIAAPGRPLRCGGTRMCQRDYGPPIAADWRR